MWDGGLEPHWSADGRELFFTLSGELTRVAVDSVDGFAVGPSRAVFPFETRPLLARNYDIDSDTGRFLALIEVEPLDATADVLRVLNYADDWIPRAKSLLQR